MPGSIFYGLTSLHFVDLFERHLSTGCCQTIAATRAAALLATGRVLALDPNILHLGRHLYTRLAKCSVDVGKKFLAPCKARHVAVEMHPERVSIGE